MSFLQHKGNLVDWIYFGELENGYERDAAVLLLGDREETAPFEELLKKRVKRVSFRLDDASYDYVLIPKLTKRVLSMFGTRTEKLIRGLSDAWLKPGGELILGIENRNEIDRIAAGELYDKDTVYLSKPELWSLRERLRRDFPDCRELLYFPLPALEMPMHIYSEERLPERRMRRFGPSRSFRIFRTSPRPISTASARSRGSQRGRRTTTDGFQSM